MTRSRGRNSGYNPLLVHDADAGDDEFDPRTLMDTDTHAPPTSATSAGFSPDYARSSFAPSSKPRASFRSSVALIPTPGVHSERPPKYEPIMLKPWILALATAAQLGIAIGLEIALGISRGNNGIHVPQRNVFSFASTQFLTSFFPTLLVMPLAFMIQSFDWSVRWWQPYVLLSTGNRRAEETLLLDYIPLNHFYVIYYAFKYKHALIVLSTISALGSYILQPLAGSLFSVRMLPKTLDGSANSIRAIGLSPQVSDLNAFASSAGFAEASVFNGLPDPPFVLENWSTAQFVFPTGDMLNGSVAVNTTAIQTNVNCANPLAMTLTTTNPANFSINATSVDGCVGGPAFFDPANAEQQYGVQAVPNCGSGSTNASFQPVMFWYYTSAANGTHEARTVFCNPQIQLFDVMAYADLASGALTSVTTLGDYPKPNNVSGAPLNGNAFNGLIFDPSNDINVQARATATKAGIPNAIFRGAAQNSSGLQSVFDDNNGFRDLTSSVYTQYLALTAKDIYFVPVDNEVFSQVTELVPRLWIEPLSAHFLTAILILEALTILYIHIRHHRARRHVYLSNPPGSIGTVVSQTAHSGFGELLLPYDDHRRMVRKLQGLRFRLDERTGAIVVDDQAVQFAGVPPGTPGGRDDTMMALVGRGAPRRDTAARGSSVEDKGEGSAEGASAPESATGPGAQPGVPSLRYGPGTRFPDERANV